MRTDKREINEERNRGGGERGGNIKKKIRNRGRETRGGRKRQAAKHGLEAYGVFKQGRWGGLEEKVKKVKKQRTQGKKASEMDLLPEWRIQ